MCSVDFAVFFARSVSLRPLILMIKHTLQRRESKLQSKRGWVIRVQSAYIFKWNPWVKYRNFARFYLAQDFKPTNNSKYLIFVVSPHLHQRVGEASCKWDVGPPNKPKNHLSFVFWKIAHISNRDLWAGPRSVSLPKGCRKFCVEVLSRSAFNMVRHTRFFRCGHWWWIVMMIGPLFFGETNAEHQGKWEGNTESWVLGWIFGKTRHLSLKDLKLLDEF